MSCYYYSYGCYTFVSSNYNTCYNSCPGNCYSQYFSGVGSCYYCQTTYNNCYYNNNYDYDYDYVVSAVLASTLIPFFCGVLPAIIGLICICCFRSKIQKLRTVCMNALRGGLQAPPRPKWLWLRAYNKVVSDCKKIVGNNVQTESQIQLGSPQLQINSNQQQALLSLQPLPKPQLMQGLSLGQPELVNVPMTQQQFALYNQIITQQLQNYQNQLQVQTIPNQPAVQSKLSEFVIQMPQVPAKLSGVVM